MSTFVPMQMWSTFTIQTSIEPVTCNVAPGEDEASPIPPVALLAEMEGPLPVAFTWCPSG